MKEYIVRGLAADILQGNAPVLLLETEDKDILPIWIGPAEAYSIATTLAKMQSPRPMTHDLILLVIKSVGAKFKRIVISGLKEGTYFGLIHLDFNDELIVIDCRPSDAIALALRANVQIFVNDDIPTFRFDDISDEVRDLKNRLREIKPGDFGLE